MADTPPAITPERRAELERDLAKLTPAQLTELVIVGCSLLQKSMCSKIGEDLFMARMGDEALLYGGGRAGQIVLNLAMSFHHYLGGTMRDIVDPPPDTLRDRSS